MIAFGKFLGPGRWLAYAVILTVTRPAFATLTATFNVTDLPYAATPNNKSFDNTPSFQKALNDAATAGGGTVMVPSGSYWFAGNLTIPANVTLTGSASGPFYVVTDPATSNVGPALLPTSTSGPFITSSRAGASVSNLIFYYPGQAQPTATAPVIYPPTILVNAADFKVQATTFVNSYIGIEVSKGAFYLQNLQIGALQTGIQIDQSLDFAHIDHVEVSVPWDAAAGLAYPQNLDSWVAQNRYGLIAYRCDGLNIEDFDLYVGYAGILLGYTNTVTPGDCDGRASNINIDNAQYGVIARSTRSNVGFVFTNLIVGPYLGSGTSVLSLQNGGPGSSPPKVTVLGGSTRGKWSAPLDVQSGLLNMKDMIGLNPIGPLPWKNLQAPPIPQSGTVFVSRFPCEAEVAISNGAVQGISVGGVPTGLTQGNFTVAPGQSIAIIYQSSAPPTWTWYLK